MSAWDDGRTSPAGRALVVIGNDRITLALVLVLQEMDLSVDVAVDGEAAVGWAQRADYDVIVCGPGGVETTDLALSFRIAAPKARVVLLAGPDSPLATLDVFDVEVVRPPLNVNTLVWRFWPTTA
jgi:DNA-binding response OmpR family regulator